MLILLYLTFSVIDIPKNSLRFDCSLKGLKEVKKNYTHEYALLE